MADFPNELVSDKHDPVPSTRVPVLKLASLAPPSPHHPSFSFPLYLGSQGLPSPSSKSRRQSLHTLVHFPRPMAMTQTVPGVHGPSWDETIVPALRKRLQLESRALTKRMSTISIGSSNHDGADNDSTEPTRNAVQPQWPTQPQPQSPAPSSSPDRTRPIRSRTYSQPFGFNPKADTTYDESMTNGSPGSLKPTRIPQPSRSHPMQQNGFSDHNKSSPSLANARPQKQPYGIFREPAPFDVNSEPRSELYHDNLDDPPKASMESEERPYEHWYRGESSRNGGVGELRVGRRQEMLDIANYGHEVRARERARAERLDELAMQEASFRDSSSRRKRADSVGMDSRRESIRNAEDTDMDNIYESYYEEDSNAVDTSVNGNAMRSTTPSQIPRPSSRQRTTPSPAIPSSSRAPGHGVVQIQRGGSEPPPSSSQRNGPSPVGTPDKYPRQNMNNSVTSSPASVTSKKMNATAINRAKKERERREKERERRSVAQYPVAEFDGDIADAVPTWTQPVASETSGNWDDVVLPAVARKKGLDGYTLTNGNSQTRQEDTRIEPAPGTFGYNHNKYRAAGRHDPASDKENIPLDDFGLLREDETARSQEQRVFDEVAQEVEVHQPPRPFQATTPKSPAPFSHYTHPTQSMSAERQRDSPRPNPQQKEQEEPASGCCSQCVVM